MEPKPKPKSELNTVHKSTDSTAFGVLDLLRIIGGVLLCNAILSWWFTSTTTWGYDGHWINPRYIHHRFVEGDLNLTMAELAKHDGSNDTPIYIAIDGRVYDVSSGARVYGPGGMYASFAGRDAARVYVTGCFQKRDEFTYDLRGLDPVEAANDIQSWQSFYDNHRKYWFVGYVQHEDLAGDPPLPCQELKYPGMKHPI